MCKTVYSYFIIASAIYLQASSSIDVCSRQPYKQLDHEYLPKDIDMFTLFIQSHVDSIDMKTSLKSYLLKYLPYKYIQDGHLRSLTQFDKNYTFLMVSSIDQYDKEVENKPSYTESTQLNYVSIDWSKNTSDILDDIINKFQISETCNTIITLYLAFPSYPEKKLLSNFFRSFERKPNQAPVPTDDVNHLSYRQYIHPSFLDFIDRLPLAVFQQLLLSHTNVRLVTCGHGFGGTIAQLSTLHLLLKGMDLHYTQLRSISLGSLFFSNEKLINYIKQRHFDQHFINIYHEMDVIPSLFNVAELLSQSIKLLETENKTPTFLENIFNTVKFLITSTSDPVKLRHSSMKNLLSWLCHSLIKSYASLSQEICDPLTIDKGLAAFTKALSFIQSILPSESIPTLIYQPIGIYNMITFRELDNTWHLIYVSNKKALYNHLIKDIESAKASEQLFNNHSLSFYMTDLQQCNLQKLDSRQRQSTLSNLIASLSINKYSTDSNTDTGKNPDVNYSVSVSLPFRFYNHLHDQNRSGISYMNMIAIPPITMQKSNDLNQHFLSAIKYRTGLSNLHLNSKQVHVKKLFNDISIYDACLSIYETCGIDARMELMKLQLDQRMLVPILVSNIETDFPPFRSYVESLSLVETHVFQSQEIRLAHDSEFLRIGLISTIQSKTGGLPDLIQNAFQALSIRQPVRGAGVGIKYKTVLETGYGFLPDSNAPSRYQPVILTHIIGDYQPLLSFLVQYVDMLIIEHDEDKKNYAEFKYNSLFSKLRIQKIIQWKYTTEAALQEIISKEEPFPVDVFEGTAKAVKSELQVYLLKILHSRQYHWAHSLRPSLANIIPDKNLYKFDDIPLFHRDILFYNVNTADLKRKRFELQHSYKREAVSQSELDNPALQLNDVRRKELNENIHREIELRRKLASTKINKIPILKSYLSIISEVQEEKRYIQKRQFESAIAELNEIETEVLRKERDRTFERMTEAIQDALSMSENDKNYLNVQNKKQQAITKHYEAKQNLLDASLNIGHFWREISHLYATGNDLYRHLPDLAAQHLTDGFL